MGPRLRHDQGGKAGGQPVRDTDADDQGGDLHSVLQVQVLRPAKRARR